MYVRAWTWSLTVVQALSYVLGRHVIQLAASSERRLREMCRAEQKQPEEFVSSWVQQIWGFADGASRENSSSGLKTLLTHDQKQQAPRSQSQADVPREADTGTYFESALRRPSTFDPDLEDDATRRYVLSVNTSRLREIAGAGRRLIVSWTTGGPKRWSIAHNLALSIRRNAPELESIFVFVALDKDAVVRAEAAGFNAVLDEGSNDLQDAIWKMRWLILSTCTSLNLEVLVVDSDIVFLSNPFQHFYLDSDLEAMTDHFFPARQLWATWLRPAEHINTGFIFSRPSHRLLEFLVEFIDAHYTGYEGPTLRDGMDQRVFNKFVMSKLQSSPPEVVSVFENKTFAGLDWQRPAKRFLPQSAWDLPRGRPGQALVLRLLDPVCISHGMNFFWLKAYKLKSCGGILGGPPAVVHVNGVDPKMYFLRDRNLWYVDDWDERFSNATAFLVYDHPQGLSLAEDFEVLLAALELAAYLRRRVVLPETMNCANCPAYEVYRMNESMVGEPGCTYDYFAHANGLYEVYSRVKPYAVEAGVAREPRFQELVSESLPGMEELQRSGMLREEVLAIQQTDGPAFRPPVLRILEDVRLLRDGLRGGAFGLRMNAERVFSCAHQEPLIGAMACLDEPYVEEFGAKAMCSPESFEEGCGPVGICCCWPFWGWGEKLQYFTGVRWDLPCDCGLRVCERYNRPQVSGSSESCCRHAGTDAVFPKTDPGVFYCKTETGWSGVTGAEDSNTYTSPALIEFASGKRTAAQSFETCRLDRMLRRGDAFREASLRECNLQFSAYLLRRSKWQRLHQWWDWMLEERRGLSNASRLIASLDGNLTTDNTGFSAGKLSHDLEQLEFLASSDDEVAAAVHDALPAFRRLSRLFAEHQADKTSREIVQAQFSQVKPFFNRALHVPDFDDILKAEVGLHELLSQGPDYAGAEVALRETGLAVLDGVLTTEALTIARRWLSQSTVWFQPLLEGTVLKAQVRDGLHRGPGLQVVTALQGKLAGLLGKQPLLDLVAYRHGPSSAGLPPHCVDGVVAALLWVNEVDESSANAGGSLRLMSSADSTSLCGNARVGPAPSLTLEDFLRKQAPTATVAAEEVAIRSNRLVLWRPSRAVEFFVGDAAATTDFNSRRVDWLMLFGKNHAPTLGDPGYIPEFEGKQDSWGGHYYAQDHDHR